MHYPGPTPQEMLFSIPIIRRNPVQYLLECSHLYGDITFFSAGKTSAVFINHPEGAKRVLQDNNSNYSKDTLQYRALSTITGKGLLTNEGPSWLHNRRIIQPAFTRPN
jgi:cytochrome P450